MEHCLSWLKILPMSRSFQPHLFVILGASGDLTSRKLVPALFHLMERHDELRCCHILGVARSDLSDAAFRDSVREALHERYPEGSALSAWCDDHVFYQSLGGSGNGYDGLARRIASIEKECGLPGNRVFYLALPQRPSPEPSKPSGRPIFTRRRAGHGSSSKSRSGTI